LLPNQQHQSIEVNYYYYYYIHLAAFFPGQPRQAGTILDFNEARDDGVAVASAGPYANHLHLVPDK